MKERERSKATVVPTAPTMPADGAQEQKLEEKALCFDSAEMCVCFFLVVGTYSRVDGLLTKF